MYVCMYNETHTSQHVLYCSIVVCPQCVLMHALRISG